MSHENRYQYLLRCMRVGRQAIVSVLLDAMVPLARLFLRIDMNNYERKIL